MATAAAIMAINRAKGEKTFRISKEKFDAGLARIKNRISELGLDTNSPKVVIEGGDKRNQRMGTDRAEKTSIQRYESIWHHLLQFCVLIGDYDSGIILARDLCPSDPLPVSVDTIINFMRFRVTKTGEPLVDHASCQAINDIDGNALVCLGDWQSAVSVKLVATALSKLHSHYTTTSGDYKDKCDACFNKGLEAARRGEGCDRCLSEPRYWRKGNPTHSPVFKNKHSMLQTYAKQVYEVRHTFAFLPGELRDIRLFLLSSNTLWGLMIWTIIICGVKGFLRVEEAINMDYSQFQQDYFVVTADDVKGLAYWVYGKSDHEKISLAMWDDDECPDFSASRAMLLWLAISGIESGKLFPSKHEVQSGKVAPSPTSSLEYNVFLDEIKMLCATVLRKDMQSAKMKKLIFGTHILRKTAYLIAFWGFNRSHGFTDFSPIDRANIMLSARHNDERSCSTYLCDSGTFKNLCNKYLKRDDPHHRVGEFESILIQTHDTFAALNLDSQKFIRPAKELADWYVFEKLQIPRGSQFRLLSVLKIHERACKYVPNATSSEQLDETLRKYLPESAYRQVTEDIQKVIQSSTVQAVQHALEIQQAANGSSDPNIGGGGGSVSIVSPAGGEKQANSEEVIDENASKKRKYNAEEIVTCSKEYQKLIQKPPVVHSKRSQIALIQEAREEITEQMRSGKILIDPLKSWIYKAGKILECIKHCHNGSIDDFIQNHGGENGGLAISRFRCNNNIKHQAVFDPKKIQI
jgi:hypothetical protein